MSKRARHPFDTADNAADIEIQRKAQSMASLFPECEPFATGILEVPTPAGPVHKIYYEQCGSPTGQPVIMLHGGPGAGCSAKMRRFHDPKHYHIVLFDQRGCGRSLPDGCLEENTTRHLIEDIERLRTLLKIEKWQAFGGSWGSTLALTYAVTHPMRVTSLVLRGIFLVKQSELEYIYHTAAPQQYPEAYESIRNGPAGAPLSSEEQRDLISAYRKRVMMSEGHDPAYVRAADDATATGIAWNAARLWCEWEDAICQLYPMPKEAWSGSGGEQRIHLHYMWSRGFFQYDGWLLDQLDRIAHIPTAIVHGRYDVVCPPASAYEVSKRLPQAKLVMVPDSGHAAWEPGTTAELVKATQSHKQY